MLKRIVGGLLVAGSMLGGCMAVAQADGLEPAPGCVQYHAEQGRISALNQCVGGLYLKSDIDRCKYLGRSESWATIDNKLYRCSPDDNSSYPGTGSAAG